MGGFVGARPVKRSAHKFWALTDFWTPSRGVPPRFVAEALRDCVQSWEQGRLEVSAVAMGNSVSSLLGPRCGMGCRCG